MRIVCALVSLLIITGPVFAAGPVNPKNASWTAPTVNTDNSALVDLAGYNVYIAPGTPTGPCTASPYVKQAGSVGSTVTVVAPVPAPVANSVIVWPLPAVLPGASGQKQAAVTAVDSTGVESGCSNVSPFSSKAPGAPSNFLVQ